MFKHCKRIRAWVPVNTQYIFCLFYLFICLHRYFISISIRKKTQTQTNKKKKEHGQKQTDRQNNTYQSSHLQGISDIARGIPYLIYLTPGALI